jgi:hypothetical protein
VVEEPADQMAVERIHVTAALPRAAWSPGAA